MTDAQKEFDLRRLDEIASLTDPETGVYAERLAIWKRRRAAGDCTQAELARHSRVLRGDVNKAVGRDRWLGD